jgi:hypothetical protein
VRAPKFACVLLLSALITVAAGFTHANALGVTQPTRVTAAPTSWAPAASAAIHPGVQTVTRGGQCTANYVFSDGANVYIGQAAHCASTGASTDTNGCMAGVLPEGESVSVGGASRPGTMVYNSWVRMHAAHEANPDVCEANDFALVKLDPADWDKVNPSVPFWGGPTGGVNVSGTSAGDAVYSYGNSGLRLGLTQLSPKYGISLGDSAGGWIHQIYTVTPGIPGDSGSAVLDSSGRALGVLRTLYIVPVPASNDIGDLGRQLTYMHAHSSFEAVQLVNGTEPFAPLI